MSLRRNAGIALIALVLAAFLRSSFAQITFRQPFPLRSDYTSERYEHHVREAGYGRLTLALLGLAILFFPFRKGEPWAWLSLAAIVVFWMLPVWVLRILAPFPGWHIFTPWVQPSPLGRAVFFGVLLPLLMTLGLCLCLPDFLKRRPRLEKE